MVVITPISINISINWCIYYKYYKWGLIAGWWYTYPSAKCDFVSWDDDIPNWMEGHKIHVPNQPVVLITPNISKDINFRIGLLFFWVPPKQFLETLKTLSIWCHLSQVGTESETVDLKPPARKMKQNHQFLCQSLELLLNNYIFTGWIHCCFFCGEMPMYTVKSQHQ